MTPSEPHSQDAGLVYVTADAAGYRRLRAGNGEFCYRGGDGRVLRDRKALARIQSLAIPPAWTDVWICADENGHLQATGRDARGRKQHRYHPRFRAVRDGAKFEKMIAFGQCLPALRTKIETDMSQRGLPREKVLATVVNLLDTTLIRIGNDEYMRANRSYGLTTLRDQHAQIDGDKLRFVFTGKSGKAWRLTLRDRRVAKVVKAAQDLPGQRLFQYVGEDGAPAHISSTDVNAYLRDISGRDITAKDFRTWGATVLAAAELGALGAAAGLTLAKANVKLAVERVAASLGNTPAICRKSYIHPEIIDSYLEGALKLRKASRAGLSAHEAFVLSFLTKRAKTKQSSDHPLTNGAAGALGPTTKLGSSSNPG